MGVHDVLNHQFCPEPDPFFLRQVCLHWFPFDVLPKYVADCNGTIIAVEEKKLNKYLIIELKFYDINQPRNMLLPPWHLLRALINICNCCFDVLCCWLKIWVLFAQFIHLLLLPVRHILVLYGHCFITKVLAIKVMLLF